MPPDSAVVSFWQRRGPASGNSRSHECSGLDVGSYVQTDRYSDRCGWTVMDTYPNEAWQRLGRMLERRRGELGYGFRQRVRFARERGGGTVSVKTISRFEKGERASYPESTVGTIEAMYQWSPGSVECVLMGGEPNALLLAPQSDRNPITTDYAPPTAGERIASWVYVRMRQRGHSDDVIHDFLDAEGLPREPTTVSAVRRIADVTGATATEVLALLGVEDISSRRVPGRPADSEDGVQTELPQREPDSFGSADITAFQR